MEILNADVEDEDHVYIMLENGEWCPEEMSRVGDLIEVQGLFDKKVFEIVGREKPAGRYIPMRMIRRWRTTRSSRVSVYKMWRIPELWEVSCWRRHLRC